MLAVYMNRPTRKRMNPTNIRIPPTLPEAKQVKISGDNEKKADPLVNTALALRENCPARRQANRLAALRADWRAV